MAVGMAVRGLAWFELAIEIAAVTAVAGATLELERRVADVIVIV
jgi:hypothetical protein